MYLDKAGKPAGYDVVLLKALAKQMGVKLDIKNLDFNGLIPGLVVEEVRHGLGRPHGDGRAEEVDHFSRAYVPYAQILAAATNRRRRRRRRRLEQRRTRRSRRCRARPPSSSSRRRSRTRSRPRSPTRTPPSSRSPRAARNGIVVENYLLAQFNKSNGNKLKEVAVPEAAHVEYGSYAVQKGNTAARQST